MEHSWIVTPEVPLNRPGSKMRGRIKLNPSGPWHWQSIQDRFQPPTVASFGHTVVNTGSQIRISVNLKNVYVGVDHKESL